MSCILCPSGAVEGNALGGPTVFKTLYNQCDNINVCITIAPVPRQMSTDAGVTRPPATDRWLYGCTKLAAAITAYKVFGLFRKGPHSFIFQFWRIASCVEAHQGTTLLPLGGGGRRGPEGARGRRDIPLGE